MKKLKEALGGSSRVLVMRVIARLHCALLAAILCAAVFDILHLDAMPVYLRGLLFCVPVALSYYAVERLPALWQYIPAALIISALSWLLLGHWGGLILGALLCFFRGYRRIIEEKNRSVFDAPHYPCLLIFAVTFLLSAFLALPTLQRLSVLSAAVYLLLCLAFYGLERVDDYLVLNRGMYNLPSRRIQHIACGALIAALVLAGALLLPAAAGWEGSLRLTMPELNGSYTYQAEPSEEESPSGDMPDLTALLGDDGESTWKIPDWVLNLFYIVALAAVAALLLWGVYRIFRNYRSSYTDNRDVVQFLKKDDEAEDVTVSSGGWKRPAFLDRSPNAMIRRHYRKTVKKAAKEPPERWRSPAEIEDAAGIDDPKLHRLYEKARYASAPCTPEDVRELKNK